MDGCGGSRRASVAATARRALRRVRQCPALPVNWSLILPCSLTAAFGFCLGVVLPLDGAMSKSEVGCRAFSTSLRAKRSNPRLSARTDELLRFARNDGQGVALNRRHPHTTKSRSGFHPDPGNKPIAACRGPLALPPGLPRPPHHGLSVPPPL